MIKRAILVIAAQRRGTEPQAVIHAGRRLGIAWRAKAWHDVAEKTHAHAVDLADMPPAQEPDGALVMLSAALLRSHLDHALIAPRGVHHPPAFLNEKGQRLFDVHVLAGRARHKGHQGVPVVGRRDDDRLDIPVV